MSHNGYSWLSLLAALTIAASLSGSWLSLWQQQQFLHKVQHWRTQVLQLQQAQRSHYRQFGQFAQSQQQLVQTGLLSAGLSSPFGGDWQFSGEGNVLSMTTQIQLPSVKLLLKDFNSYRWQAPELTLKVIAYESF